MDEMESTLPEMKHFVLPGGNPIVSYCHLARTVCRRAERCVVYLSETDHVSPLILKYLNRLSDYLFVFYPGNLAPKPVQKKHPGFRESHHNTNFILQILVRQAFPTNPEK